MARILVIDDEDAIRGVLKRILSMAGHEVVEAEDGDVGTRLFEASDFDLVITDLIMPEKEGIETILDLREGHPDVRILVVSGGHSLDKTGSLEDAEALGADASLAKPFSVEELLGAVDALLAKD
ncbi:response regulator [Gemmatimonadota bacterium]